MWVCQRCQYQNQDTAAVCVSCGTARSVRRFGSSPQTAAPAPAAVQRPAAATAPAPRVTPSQSSSSAPASGADSRAAARTAYQPPQEQPEDDYEYEDEDEYEYDRPGRGGSVFGKIVGGLLIVLLPLLTALLAWRQYDLLSAALLPLYLTEKAPEWLRSVFYGALTAAAVLLSMLPGLWTLLLSRKPRGGHEKA